MQCNQVAEERQKFRPKVCRYLVVAVGRAIVSVGYLATQNQWLNIKSAANIGSGFQYLAVIGIRSQGFHNFIDLCVKLKQNNSKVSTLARLPTDLTLTLKEQNNT